MADSTHKCEVFKVTGLQPVANADNLLMCTFYNYQCIVRKGEFNEGDLAVYIPPDNIVPDTPSYAFLGGHLRIKARRFRGTWSQGLVVKAPEGLKQGDDAAGALGITHYVPPLRGQTQGSTTSRKWWKYGTFEKGPPVEGPYYDIESWWRYGAALVPGEVVEVREKIHGTNARFTFQDGRLWVASRSGYRRSTSRHYPWWVRLLRRVGLGHLIGVDPRQTEGVYWKAIGQNPWLEELCRRNEGVVFYGEIFGDVQDLKYGATEGQLFVTIFDAYAADASGLASFISMPNLRALLLSHPAGREIAGSMPPLLYRGPYDEAAIKELISGPSWVSGAKHVREGVVIRPIESRYAHNLGRVILKAVSPAYLERSKD